MPRRPEFLSFDLGDVELGALRWAGIDGAPTIVALHGITSNAWSWDPVAHHLAGGANLIALDLRGRGRSYEAARTVRDRTARRRRGPRHRENSAPRALVAGHSMGAYVALMAAERHRNVVDSIVLVDGGTPLPLPAGIDPTDVDALLDATLGPAIDRLHKVWADRTSYYSMWSAHPAFAERHQHRSRTQPARRPDRGRRRLPHRRERELPSASTVAISSLMRPSDRC